MDGECWVTTSLLVDAGGRPDVEPSALARLRAQALEHSARAHRAGAGYRGADLAFGDVRPKRQWDALVNAAVREIRSGTMEKIVLARAVRARAGRELEPAAVLRQLRTANPECYIFGCWIGERAFVGASPELLVRLDGHEVRTTSLAGSIRRGTTPAEDAALRSELLGSAKDRAEQEMVRRELVADLAELCDAIVAPAEPAVLTLRNVHHLHTPISARLRPGRSLLDLVGRLHPTPAVGGAPTDAALRVIREHERLDRGWYAAPIGWMGERGGEFAVALRSALVAGRDAWLFAGCGIVADSTPDAEYDESLLKLIPMRRALSAALSGDEGVDDDTAAEPLRASAVGDDSR